MTPDARGEFTVLNAESDLVVTVEGVRKHEAVNDEWLSDDSTHWHQCACGDKIDEAKHDFEWVVDKPATVETKGERHEECTVCGETDPNYKPDQPTQPTQPENPGVKTGDDSNTTMWVIVLICAAALAVVLVVLSRKKRNS